MLTAGYNHFSTIPVQRNMTVMDKQISSCPLRWLEMIFGRYNWIVAMIEGYFLLYWHVLLNWENTKEAHKTLQMMNKMTIFLKLFELSMSINLLLEGFEGTLLQWGGNFYSSLRLKTYYRAWWCFQLEKRYKNFEMKAVAENTITEIFGNIFLWRHIKKRAFFSFIFGIFCCTIRIWNPFSAVEPINKFF